jgi:hypothetical protein
MYSLLFFLLHMLPLLSKLQMFRKKSMLKII